MHIYLVLLEIECVVGIEMTHQLIQILLLKTSQKLVSFLLPLLGVGAKYGESVSRTSSDKGI